MNGKNSGGGQRQLSGKFVTIVTLTVLAALIVAVALFMSLYKPGVEERPHFPTGTTTETPPDITTADDKQTSVDPYKRKKGYYTFLIAGTDVISNNTDVLMLASIDTEKGEINIIQIPRDTFVNKEVGGYQTVTRVNSVYAAAYNRSTKAGTRGESARHIAMKELKARLEESLCVNIDYYALVNTSSFRRIVDAVGGVWFDVPKDMDYDDPEQGLSIHLKEGYQLLDGEQAMGLVRFRYGYMLPERVCAGGPRKSVRPRGLHFGDGEAGERKYDCGRACGDCRRASDICRYLSAAHGRRVFCKTALFGSFRQADGQNDFRLARYESGHGRMELLRHKQEQGA